ncbi:hypothetical protein ACFWJT_15760 [Streptomyces sp. NPDC127069]|uniref:hypothetical protein n=1 Tax=Streptomyces sp. NPDC127069 TaxID=3347128 RepID=UPI00364A099E
MDPLIARLREIADDIDHGNDPRKTERAAYFRGRADHIKRHGRTDSGLTETTDY